MNSGKKRASRFHVGDWVAFQYGPEKASAKVVEDRGPIGMHGRRLYRVRLDLREEIKKQDDANEEDTDDSLFEVPEDDLEPTLPPVRLWYDVTYDRQGNANVWQAAVKKQRVVRGAKAQGAVGYSTGLWEGETVQDIGHATVSVLLEVDPRFGDPGFDVSAAEWQVMAKRARDLADELFRSRHPRARIVANGGDEPAA